ncbi:MAG: flagellar hook-associated protein FlgL [Gammaproteobacteria bacterium]|nr:MAG: flagellar hook-associated protein FlgL [Gammaproteobacteria bacterium]
MRISTNQFQILGVNAILDQQAKVSKTQLQLSTGRRLLQPSDDPVAATRVLSLTEALTQGEQFQKNIIYAESRLGITEGKIDGVINLLQRVREMALQANSGFLSTTDRDNISQEIRERAAELLGLANSTNVNGEYIFAGFQGQTQPFSQTAAGTFNYAGDEGQRFLQISENRQIAVTESGTDVFRQIRNGNGTFTTNYNTANSGSGVIDPGSVNGSFISDTYTITFSQPTPTSPITYGVTGATSGVVVAPGTAYVDGADILFNGVRTNVTGTPANGDSFTVVPSTNQDMFTTVENFVSALAIGTTTSNGAAASNNQINRVIIDLDRALDNVVKTQARVGARQNAIANQKSLNDEQILDTREVLSDTQDLDIAEAASRLSRQLVSLQAAQQVFIKVQNLSLFNFLS